MLVSIKVHGGEPVSCVAWRGEGGLLTGAFDSSIALYRYDAENEAKQEEYTRSVAEAKDDKARAEIPKPPSVINRIQTYPGAHTLGVVSVGVNPEGTVAASVGSSGEIAAWSLESYEKLATVAGGPGEAWKIGFSPVDNVFATGGFGGKVNIYSVPSLEKTASINTGAPFLHNVKISADGKQAAAVADNGKAYVIDLTSGTVTHTIDAHHLPARAVSFSHDARMLYTCGEDRRINVFDISGVPGTQSLVCSLTGHMHWVNSVAAAPTEYYVASGSSDKTVRIWDVRKREAVHTFEGYADKVWDVAWNNTGSRVAAVTDGGVLGVHVVSGLV